MQAHEDTSVGSTEKSTEGLSLPGSGPRVVVLREVSTESFRRGGGSREVGADFLTGRVCGRP